MWRIKSYADPTCLSSVLSDDAVCNWPKTKADVRRGRGMSISYVAFLLFHTSCTLARYVGLNANEKIKEKWEVHFCPPFFCRTGRHRSIGLVAQRGMQEVLKWLWRDIIVCSRVQCPQCHHRP